MSSRSVSWRRLCSDVVNKRIDEALQTVIYIVHQTGPTGFVLRQGENKFKAFLGDVHTCTCSIFRKEKELCIHILWLLLKKFRVPKSNPVVHQLGLVEREINEVLHGHFIRQSPQTVQDGSTAAGGVPLTGSCDQRPVTLDDVCPICQNDLLGKPQKLSYCKYGCGKSVHLKCIKMWAEHQKTQGEVVIHCPLCREKFSTFEELRRETYNNKSYLGNTSKAAKQSLHYGVSCSQCQVCPIAGKCYKCVTCVDPKFFLCQSCFTFNHHSHHSFQFQQHPGNTWRNVFRGDTSLQTIQLDEHSQQPSREVSLPQSFIDDLQSREINSNDYELLLQLDQSNTSSPVIVHRRRSRVRHSFKTEPLDHNNPLLLSGATCLICSESFQRGDWIRKLPCKHKFHRDCIDALLNQGHSNCPIDGKNLYESLLHQTNSSGTRRSCHIYSRHDSSSTNSIPSYRRDMSAMSVSGQGLTITAYDNPFRSSGHNGTIRNSGIRKGSALQRPSPSIQNTSYIGLNVTPLLSTSFRQQQQQLTDTSTTAQQTNNTDNDRRLDHVERRHKSSFVSCQSKTTRTSVGQPTSSRRLLPQITNNTPTRLEMNSLLHVSSLSTSLPPII